MFEELTAGDVLFVDTAYTVKTGGDVVWIFHEIIPRLAPGVLIHIHDFFVPGEYPEPWVMEGWGWNESHLVRSFLSFNDSFEVVWAQQYMLYNHLAELRDAFPGLERYVPSGAALWLRRSAECRALASRETEARRPRYRYRRTGAPEGAGARSM